MNTARFEVVVDPRKATAAGTHFYGWQIMSVESYTFLHPQRYRSSLLIPHYGPTTHIYSGGIARFKRKVKFEPIPASGLMGPVRIVPHRPVKVEF